ncbi:MAG: DUF3656 domain-containing protein [Christensenellales bacterium]|nr:DUF3656 domain-containing protein [Christensenellales bacterium]
MRLLSPAGSPESLLAALKSGADGVYFGGAAFNARRGAANFSDAEMEKALDLCHLYGAKAFITMNTLLTDRELPEAMAYARFLYRAGADALIVCDMGLIQGLRRELPDLPLHGSTQLGIGDIPGARLLQRLGFSCGVLARETPLSSIAAIRRAVDLPLEAFVHGALCMSFSGACLYSSMAGERSGNRGTCAQPCRKPCALNRRPGEGDYALSLSDLCMLEHLGDLEKAGVSWLKIEGRMKRPAYVAGVTAAYRAALDGAGPAELAEHRERLLALFDRGGGRTGYFYGDDGITGCVAHGDPPAALVRQMEQALQATDRRLPVQVGLTVRQGEASKLRLSLDEGIRSRFPGPGEVTAMGPAPAQANKPQDPQRYLAQGEKLGGTPFVSQGGEIQGDAWAFLPVREINELRRQAVEALEASLRLRRQLPAPAGRPTCPAAPFTGETGILAAVRTQAQARAAAQAGADMVALEAGLGAEQALAALQPLRETCKLLICLPGASVQGRETERLAALLQSPLLDGALAGNLGQIGLMEGLPLRIAGPQLGAFNREGVQALKALGFHRVVLSLELTKAQMRDILAVEAAGVSGYGRAQLMQLFHCPIREQVGCKACPGDGAYIEDGEGRRFPLSSLKGADGCLVRLLNCLPTDVLDLVGQLPKPDTLHLAFYEESPEQAAALVRRAKAALAGAALPQPQGCTRGHWNRAVD